MDRRYCASHLSDATPDGLYTVVFPMPEENNGNGTATAGMALPGHTPWRTLTVGDNLTPIVETTVPWDVVEPPLCVGTYLPLRTRHVELDTVAGRQHQL